jgi:acyl transferase domain-containing protein
VFLCGGTLALLGLPGPVFIEAGPCRALIVLTGQRAGGLADVIPTLGDGASGGDEVTQMLSAAGRFWQAGGALDHAAFPAEGRRRVPLPTYPFERQRYWIEPDQPGTVTAAHPGAEARVTNDPATWIYRPSWRRATPIAAEPGRSRRRWLVFDDGKLGRALADRLERAGEDAYRVIAGSDFAEPDYRCFSVAAVSPSDHKALLAALAEREAMPDHIVFLWPQEAAVAATDLGPAQALHNLIDTLAGSPRPTRLTVVTRGAADVTGSETLVPEQALIQGVLQVAAQEYPWLGGRQIDLDPDSAEPASVTAERLRLELRIGATDIATALRARNRWVLDFAVHRLPEPTSEARLRRNGVFIIAGDLKGGLGKVWADALATLPGARLALLQDARAETLPPPTGVEVLDRRLNCASVEAMSAALSEAAETWGRIDGVFLSSPMSNHPAVAPLALLSASHWDYNLAARIAPLRALATATADRKVGFCCVQSSLSSIVGGPALAAYASVHHMVDSFVAARDRDSGTPWFAINWDAIDTEAAPANGAGRVAAANPFAVTPGEAWDCTRRILEAGLSGQTVVSKGDLSARRAEWLHTEPREEERQATTGGHKRPDLATPFVAARNEIEATVAGIFQELLGIDAVGMDDGFFELGGHSLLAIRAIARLREAFPVDVEMRELLFESPTAAGIARAIAARLPAEPDLDAMAELLRQVEAMSEDEVSRHMPGGNVA